MRAWAILLPCNSRKREAFDIEIGLPDFRRSRRTAVEMLETQGTAIAYSCRIQEV
jgi:hypothetical protein